MSTQLFAYFSLFLLVSVVGINAQLFAAPTDIGLYGADSFGTESGYAPEVYLNPMELAQIMDAQKAEEMRGFSYGGGGSPSYGGGDSPSYGGGSPSYGGGPGYGGPVAPVEPQGPPDGPPRGYGEEDHSEGPSDGPGPNQGPNYQGPDESEEYSGPPQQTGGGYHQQGLQQYGQGNGPQGGPNDNDGGYSNEGDAYRQEGDPYRQEGPPTQSNYDQSEEERTPPGNGNGYNGPQHVGNSYGQNAPSENYNGKYRQLIVDRPQQQHGRPQGYHNENGYESNGHHESEQRQPSYESSGYENDKALKPHAMPQAQYIQPSSGYSQPDEYESNNSPNERPPNNGFRPMNGQPVNNGGYNRGSTREYYQNDPV